MRVLVVGKCHSRGIASAWQAVRPADEVSSVTWVKLRKGYSVARLIADISEADHVFVEANAMGVRELSARELGFSIHDEAVPMLAAALERATLYPVTHFSGYHPDFLRLEKTGCSHIALAAHAMGMSQARAAELFNSYIYSALGYFDEYDKAESFALQVGQASGFDLSNMLQPVNGQAFMHIPTQPTIGFWMRFAGLLCSSVGLEYDADAASPIDEPAGELVWPVYPELAEQIGVEGGLDFKASKKQGFISFEEMIASCYRILDEFGDDSPLEARTRLTIAKLREELE